MKEPKVIAAGAFTIEKTAAEVVQALRTAMGMEFDFSEFEANETLPRFLDVRSLRLWRESDDEEEEEGLPPLFAMALDAPVSPVWMVRGETILAVIPVKNKHKDNPDKVLRPLVSWAETLSPTAVLGLITVAYPHLTDGFEDDSIHLLVDLPLQGISVHRLKEVEMDQWLDDLTDSAEEALDRVDADGEVILFDSSDEGRSSISGHVSVFADDEEDAVTLVRDALLEAFSAFTPKGKVREALSVTIEEGCMYDMIDDLLDELEDED